jgi:hypothetical protein
MVSFSTVVDTQGSATEHDGQMMLLLPTKAAVNIFAVHNSLPFFSHVLFLYGRWPSLNFI